MGSGESKLKQKLVSFVDTIIMLYTYIEMQDKFYEK